MFFYIIYKTIFLIEGEKEKDGVVTTAAVVDGSSCDDDDNDDNNDYIDFDNDNDGNKNEEDEDCNDEEDDEEEGPPSYTFFYKVSRPDNLLRRLIDDTMVFTQSRCSMTIREEDVRGAVATIGFQIPQDIDTTETISKDDPFRGRVIEAFSYTLGDFPIENSALLILKIVEEAFNDTNNFRIVRTPKKQG